MTYSLAVDIGGTFTDLLLLERVSGELSVAKVLTSYPDPSRAVLDGIRQLLHRHQVDPATISRLIHGTTLVTNALIERKGARTALITTEGFRDALAIGREGRYDIYDLNLQVPEPLVERRLRLEASERLTAEGEVLTPLDVDHLSDICAFLVAEEIESVAITFLHAYTNPVHELQALQIIRQKLPRMAISLSHQVAPEWREYERSSTTVANAYVQPLTDQYLHGLAAGLKQLGVTAPLHVMLSTAGTCAAETAAAFPVRLVESGPAGGALGASYWGRQAGYDEVLAFDMGGTTAKAALSDQGRFRITNEAEVARVQRFKRGSGLPLLVPMLDLIEIGAGGGSIARLNPMGLPVVGPDSAGSTPGPACYGQGGDQPTVTDADLLLGYLNPDYFVGGQMTLDSDAAGRVIDNLAATFHMDQAQMAWGIHQLVNETMAGAARVHAAERGLDIRRYVMVATGGAGPVHACGVAERLGINRVIVPPMAGVGSAFGMQLAPISFDYARTHIVPLADMRPEALNDLIRGLEQEGRQVVLEAGVPPDAVTVSRAADMRYAGQGFNIRFQIPDEDFDQDAASQLQALFESEYSRIYGRLSVGVPVQAVNWRVTVSGPLPSIPSDLAQKQHHDDAAKPPRQAIFQANGATTLTPVFDRYRLPGDFQVLGPAIIEEAESTTILQPGWSARLDPSGVLILVREALIT